MRMLFALILSLSIAEAAWESGPYVEHKLGLNPTSFSLAKALTLNTTASNSDLRSFASSIKDQGDCGSCVAFASMGLFELQFNLWTGFPIYNMDMSEQHLFSCGGGKCNDGWTPDDALSFMKNTGITDESCLPYVAKDVACTDGCKRLNKIQDWSEVEFKDFPGILASGKPVMTGMAVYSDFMTYKSGIYEYTTGALRGLHAVVVVGFNAEENYFIVRNSWGAAWGETGYFRIKANDKSLIFNGYTITIK